MFGLKFPEITPEHTDSYYAATATDVTHPALVGDLEADVVVVGGGFSGVNTALELSERGMSVVLLEAHRVAWGATGRNGGQVIGGLGHDPEKFRNSLGEAGVRTIHELGIECVEIIRERVEKYAIDCDLRWGYCEVALKPRHLRWLEEAQKEQSDLGYPHALTLLDAEQVKQFVGSDLYLGGLYNATGAGHLHPMKLCQGEARAAREQGTQIFEQSQVLRIEHGERPRVYTQRGSVSARQVVLCGNAYMENLVPQLARRLFPASSCIITTEPLSQELADAVLPRDVAVCDLRTALDYFRLTSDRRMLFGGLSNYTGLVPTDYEQVMRDKMLKIFPQLQGVAIDYAWDGQLGIGLNRMPQLGRITDNTYFIQAFSGHGVAPTHVMARLVAEAISGDTGRFDVLSGIRHWPIPGGSHLRRLGMAMGMLYFKALDYL